MNFNEVCKKSALNMLSSVEDKDIPTFCGVPVNEFEKDELVRLVAWCMKYYNGRLEQSRKDFDLMYDLGMKK
jgi:hypothetical protein